MPYPAAFPSSGGRAAPAHRPRHVRRDRRLGRHGRVQAVAAIESAFAAVGAVDAAMHPERAGSTLARINTASPGMRIDIDAGTHQLLELSRRLHRLTHGVFDPCLPQDPAASRTWN